MADVNVSVQQIDRAALTPVYTGSLSTGNNYLVPNDGRTFLHIKKSGASNCTVTVVTPGTVAGQAIADLTATVVATTGDKMMGPFPPDVFGPTMTVTFSEITGLTMAAVRL